MDEVDQAIRDMAVVKCGGCQWRRVVERAWRCGNPRCPAFDQPVAKDAHENCGWWDARSLLRRGLS
jgi:hypothetical protein